MLPKEKSAAAIREAKRRLENPLTEAQKAEKAADDVERLRKIHRTADRNSKRLRVMVERRSVAGANKELAAKATRLSTHRKTNPSTVEEKAKKALADAVRYRQTRLTVEQKAEQV
jgi:alkanesulfonate monooxygenase SsuD/methylene tetrahydromethanopterin reductase-like flavin-dependent oxidoreductase (luciferase family)